MAEAITTPVKMTQPSPLRFQGWRASEPTLCRRAPSGSPPLLVSSNEFRTHRSLSDYLVNHRRRCPSGLIRSRCDWVDRNRGAPVAPPAADDPTGAPPHLERVDCHHHLHHCHLWPLFIERLRRHHGASPTHPCWRRGHRALLRDASRFYLFNYKRNFHYALNFWCFKFVV